MKRNFLFTLVGIIVMLTSCNTEEVGSLATNKTTSFNVSVDDGVKTRAGNAVTDLTRYVMEIYKGATATGTPEMHKEQATGVFTDILLDNAQEYTVLFWADYGTPSTDGTHNAANEYNAADLKVAKVAKQPTKAAYSGVSKFTVGTTAESAYTNVKLKHAVAQVNFAQTEKLTSATNTLTVSYPESYSLNVEDNAVTKIDGVVTHNFTYNNDAAGTLGTSYIIAATGNPKTVLEITATLNSETAIAVSNVPFERNFKTNISGAYSSKYSAVLNVSCDETWGTDNDKVFPETPKTAVVGDYYYQDGTYSATYTPNISNPCIGIVFYLDPTNPNHGKIVSLDECDYRWGVTVIGNTEWLDGRANTAALAAYINDGRSWDDFPILKWIAAKNNKPSGGWEESDKWYLPAFNEIRQLYVAISGKTWVASGADASKNEVDDWGVNVSRWSEFASYGDARTAFNKKITDANGTAINFEQNVGNYASSTEFYLNKEYGVFMAYDSSRGLIVMGTGLGTTGEVKARAFMKF